MLFDVIFFMIFIPVSLYRRNSGKSNFFPYRNSVSMRKRGARVCYPAGFLAFVSLSAPAAGCLRHDVGDIPVRLRKKRQKA